MAAKDEFQRYVDVGAAFTAMTRKKAEELVADLVHNGEFSSADARAKVDELLERSRVGRELLVAQVRSEVSRQLDSIGVNSLEDLAVQVAALLGRTADAGREATAKTKTAKAKTKTKTAKAKPTKTSTTKKKAGGPKAATPDGTATKKSAAKKSTAKKSAAKKSTATKAAGGATKKTSGGGSSPAPGPTGGSTD